MTPKKKLYNDTKYIILGGDHRTIVLKENTAIIQAGAGIVADSDPETEHKECLAKMGALIKAVEYAEKSENP